MEDENIPPSIECGKPTELFVDIAICEKFHINPLDYFCKKNNEEWGDHPEIRVLLFAYHQLIAEYEAKQIDKMKNEHNNKGNTTQVFDEDFLNDETEDHHKRVHMRKRRA